MSKRALDNKTIAEIQIKKKHMSISKLARMYFVSEKTIRNYLKLRL
jgi:DeoR/GlpR family transcriptional regulator of sugar metabolism